MSDWLYDWMKDFAMPALAGIGGIVVGTGAVVAAYASNKVAGQSLALAQQVRDDEQRRADHEHREQYRDQVLRVLEPCVTSLLEHREELLRSRQMGTAGEIALRAVVLGRLRLLLGVVVTSDLRLVDAAIKAYRRAILLERSAVVADVVGRLVIAVPALLSDVIDRQALIDEIAASVDDAMAFVDEHERSARSPESDHMPRPDY